MTNRNKEKDESAIEKAPQAGAAQVVERNPMEAATYRILNRTDEEIVKAMEIFDHNLRGQKLTERDLPIIKVPPQGMTIWTVPTTEGDTHHKELTGILVEYTTPRAYWDKPMEPGSVTPPVCSSPDGLHGTRGDGVQGKPGEMGGPCHLCPFSKYGSDPREDSNGQACKEKRMLFLLTPESLMPVVAQGPSTSIRNVFEYTMGLANEETPFHHVYTQLTLEKVAAGGVEYSKIILKNVGPVPEEFHSQLESYRNGLANILSTQEVNVAPDVDIQTAPAAEHQPDGGEEDNAGGNGEGADAGGNGGEGNEGTDAGKEPEAAGAKS